jgi:hypothetical protein
MQAKRMTFCFVNLKKGGQVTDVGTDEKIILKWMPGKGCEGLDRIELAQNNILHAYVNAAMDL